MNNPYIVSLDHNIGTVFCDFWKFPYAFGDAKDSNLHIRTGDSLEEGTNHSVILLTSAEIAKPHILNNHIRFFAGVKKLNNIPDRLEKIASIKSLEGKTVSYILRDNENKIIYIPFSIEEAMISCYNEAYRSRIDTMTTSQIAKLFYLMKPIIKRDLQLTLRSKYAMLQAKRSFPKWPLETSLEDLKSFIFQLFLSVARRREIPFIWFWPNDKKYCALLTHDVESEDGLINIGKIMDLEQKYGLRSSFNIVPKKYPVSNDTLDKIRKKGFEVGLHGYNHDGKLFSSEEIFSERAPVLQKVRSDWGAKGFRAASTHRNPNLLKLLDLEYDSSFPDTDPFEPQPGGCLSLFPFFIGNMIELPITMPQDHTLFCVLRETGIRIWKEKADEIKKRNGIVCVISHPDKGYIFEEDKIKYYIELLEMLAKDSEMWNPLPREAAQWWRNRHHAEIVCCQGKLKIKEYAHEMSICFAKEDSIY